MEKFDQNIREKLANRRIQPSVSAWERMSEQLDAVEKKNHRKWFLYIGYAASILILVSLFFILEFKSSDNETILKDVFVKESIDTTLMRPNRMELVPKSKEVIVQNDVEFKTKKKITSAISLSTPIIAKIELKTFGEDKIQIPKIKIDSFKQFNSEREDPITEIQKEIKEVIKPDFNVNSPIKVSSDALLYAVTHQNQDVKEYYKKYLISREQVLKTIEKELQKSNLKIDAKTILAEVEMNLIEESFQNNFLKNVKKRVSDVITLIANRND